ncbi:MAG: ion transporter [Gammaproteobacteria bacterium]
MRKIDLESRFYNICTKVNSSLSFQLFSLIVIIFISFVIGMSFSTYEIFSKEQISLIKVICSIYFVIEITIRYFGHSVWDSKSIVGDRFSYVGIRMDAFIIFIAFLPYTLASNLIVLRIFRIFAHPQITKFVPNIAISNFSIIKDTGIKILYVTGIIIALTYIYAIIGIVLYGETLPAMWGNLGTAFLSMITILLETDAISIFYKGLLDLNRPESLVFIMSYVIIGKLTILNLIIAILIDLLKAKEL